MCKMFLVIFLWQCIICYGSQRELTVNVASGTAECFWETVKTGQVIEVAYEVIDGDHGDLDINFHWYSPRGSVLVSDFKNGENNHKVTANEDGDYKLCWDNTISSFNFKTVFFEILIDQDKDQNTDDWWTIMGKESAVEQYALKVEDIVQSVSRVHSRLSSIRQMQDLIRAHEARDRNRIETSCEMVNTWSMLQVLVMCAVGAIQVVMVRSLFDDKSKVHNFWKSTVLFR